MEVLRRLNTASEFGTMSMHRRFRACADEILDTVTVVHGVYKIVTRTQFFGVIRQHEVSGGTWMFRHCDIRMHTNLER